MPNIPHINTDELTQLSVTQRVELTLEQMEMTREELVELLSKLLGAGKESELDEVISIEGGVDIEPLAAVYSAEVLAELAAQLDFLQRLRMLEKQGITLDPLELEMLIQAARGSRVDTKTCELVQIDAKQKELRKLLSVQDVANLKTALSRMETEAAIVKTVTSSGDAAMQQKVLDGVAKELLPKGQSLEIGKDKTLYVKQQGSIEKTGKDVQKRLIRLDYQSDMKKLFSEIKSFIGHLKAGLDGDSWRKSGALRHVEEDAGDAAMAGRQVAGEGIVQGVDEAHEATEKDQKKLKVLDYASDMKRMFKGLKNALLGKKDMDAAAASEHKNDDEWGLEDSDLHLGDDLEGENLRVGAEEASDIVMSAAKAGDETQKDQKTLEKLDHMNDMAKLRVENPSLYASQTAMKGADLVIRASNLDAQRVVAEAVSEGLSGVSGGKSATMSDLKDSLEQVKEQKAEQEKDGREIS